MQLALGYEELAHDDKDASLYNRFTYDWALYRTIVNHSFALMQQNDQAEAINIYRSTARTAYDAASDTLGVLTDVNVARASEATERAAATYQKVKILNMAAMLAGVLLVMVGVVYIRRSISAPMLKLASIMQRLSINDLDVSIEGSHRHDEIGEMARSLKVFRNNAIDLISSREGLAQQASMLEEKLGHDRELMTRQRNFVAMASHEFRTPLNIIDGHAQRLLKTKQLTCMEDSTERAQKIRRCVRDMTRLSDDLINAFRVFEEHPDLYYHPTNIDVASLLHEVWSRHREIVSRTQIEECVSELPLMISADPKLLQQMLGNLLSNAIKFSPNGGVIEVSAAQKGGYVIVSVQDHGMGIPVKDIGVVCDRYSRGSNVAGITGTGLGLYLVKKVVELHQGSINVESVEGVGTTVQVMLPLCMTDMYG